MRKSLVRPISVMFLVAIILAVIVFVFSNVIETWAPINRMLFRLVFGVGYMWAPGIVAIIYARKEHIRLPLKQKPNRYFFYALATPIILTVVTIIVSLLFGTFSSTAEETFYSYPQLQFLAVLSPWIKVLIFYSLILVTSLIAALTVNFIAALGEEFMWRGYLLEKLKNESFGKASLIIGALWGLWHAPIIILWRHNYPFNPYLGSLWMIMFALLLTPMMIFLTKKGKSILVATIFHGSLNAFLGYSLMFYPTSNRLLVGMLGLTGFAVMGVMNLLLFWHMKKNPNTLGFEE